MPLSQGEGHPRLLRCDDEDFALQDSHHPPGTAGQCQARRLSAPCPRQCVPQRLRGLHRRRQPTRRHLPTCQALEGLHESGRDTQSAGLRSRGVRHAGVGRTWAQRSRPARPHAGPEPDRSSRAARAGGHPCPVQFLWKQAVASAGLRSALSCRLTSRNSCGVPTA